MDVDSEGQIGVKVRGVMSGQGDQAVDVESGGEAGGLALQMKNDEQITEL